VTHQGHDWNGKAELTDRVHTRVSYLIHGADNEFHPVGWLSKNGTSP